MRTRGEKYFIFYLGELFEVSLDVLQAGGGGQSSNEDLLCSHHQFRVGLPRHGNLSTEINYYEKQSPLHHELYLRLYKFAVQLVLRKGEDPVDAGRVAECDESETSGSPGCGIFHHHHLRHVAKLRKILPDILGRGLPGEASNEHLAGVIGDLVHVDRSQRREHSRRAKH